MIVAGVGRADELARERAQRRGRLAVRRGGVLRDGACLQARRLRARDAAARSRAAEGAARARRHLPADRRGRRWPTSPTGPPASPGRATSSPTWPPACWSIPIWIPQSSFVLGCWLLLIAMVDELVVVVRGEQAELLSARSKSGTRRATSPPTSERHAMHGHPSHRRAAARHHAGAARRRRLDRDDAGHRRLGRPGLLHQHAAGQEPVLRVLGNATRRWELAALPLFIWMGEILFRTKLSRGDVRGPARPGSTACRAG